MPKHPIEDWLPSGTLVGTPDQVYAYGMIALTYNKLEDAMVELLAAYLPVSEEAAFRFASKLTNNERLGLLIDLLEDSEQNEDVRDRVTHAVKLFNLCAENRNILAHGIRDSHVFSERLFILRKWASDGKKVNFYDISLDQLRQVALDMRTCMNYVVELLIFLITHRCVDPRDAVGMELMGRAISLPEKPRQPGKLNPRPPGVDHEASLRRSQPSDPSQQSDDQV